MKPKLNVAVFCTPEIGHFAVLLPMIERLVRTGLGVFVFSHRRFHASVSAAGAELVEVFDDAELHRVDSRSRPIPCRYVSIAPHHAVALAERLRDLGVRLIIYETFCVSAVVCAKLLGLPHVNVCPSHNPNPSMLRDQLSRDPRVAVADECHEAVEVLKRRFGIENASPFWYVDALSDVLNVHCEPPEFLAPSERIAFEPTAFFGSLSDDALGPSRRHGVSDGPSVAGSQRWFRRAGTSVKLYAAFGTVISRYYQSEADRIVNALAELARDRPELDVVVSHRRGAAEAAADWSVLSLQDQVNQWEVLGEADVFLTHHGVGSTHEAIARGVPMISYPFFWDQPSLATRCQELGLAVALVDTPRAAVTKASLGDVVERVREQRDAFRMRLDRAREWEAKVIGARRDVVRRIVELA